MNCIKFGRMADLGVLGRFLGDVEVGRGEIAKGGCEGRESEMIRKNAYIVYKYIKLSYI